MASSSIVSNIQPWSLGEREVAYNLEKTAKTRGLTEAKVWQLYVPKLIPRITKGLPKETVCALSKAPFINAADCKPVVQSSCKQRNYIEVKRPDNHAFTYKYKTHDMLLQVDVLHQDPDNLRISDVVDNSVPK